MCEGNSESISVFTVACRMRVFCARDLSWREGPDLNLVDYPWGKGGIGGELGRCGFEVVI